MAASILEGYVREASFAKTELSPRTIARYRSVGLPWVRFGGKVYIDLEGGREWLRRQVNHPQSSVSEEGFEAARLRGPSGFRRLTRRGGNGA
jgi:hypothetical protein